MSFPPCDLIGLHAVSDNTFFFRRHKMVSDRSCFPRGFIHPRSCGSHSRASLSAGSPGSGNDSLRPRARRVSYCAAEGHDWGQRACCHNKHFIHSFWRSFGGRIRPLLTPNCPKRQCTITPHFVQQFPRLLRTNSRNVVAYIFPLLFFADIPHKGKTINETRAGAPLHKVWRKWSVSSALP